MNKLKTLALAGLLTLSSCFEYKKTEQYEVFKEVVNNCEYDKTPTGRKDWQSPRETMEKRKGNCADLTILLYEMLDRRGIIAKPVVGVQWLDHLMNKSRHSWIETEIDGETYILDPANSNFLKKKNVGSGFYMTADELFRTSKLQDMLRDRVDYFEFKEKAK